jgi:hypothetical protein
MSKRVIAISLSLVLILLLVLPVSAQADSGNVQILGSVSSTITVTVPGTFAMPDFVPGNNSTSSAKAVTVNTNGVHWTLKVVESGTSPDGKMSGTNGTLTNTLKVKGGDVADYTSLASEVTLKTGSVTGESQINNIYFQQSVASGDVAGEYSITVTFTAALTS